MPSLFAQPLLVLVLSTLPSFQPSTDNADLGSRERFDRLQKTLARIADDVRPSVVAIRAERSYSARGNSDDEDLSSSRRRRGYIERLIPAVGSGVIIDANGLILTNEHVVQNAEPSHIEIILSTGEVYSVRGITSDPRSDLAVLRIDAEDLKPAQFGDLSEVRQGHFAVVIGNPFGTASDNEGRPSMSFGVISAVGQNLTEQLDITGARYYGNLIQTDARINPGNSGGPLINMRGEVIGINTAISTRSGGSEGVGFAIPIEDRTRETISTLIEGRTVEYGYLGVDLDRPSSNDRESAGGPDRGGALITRVGPDTPAYAAEFREDDIISEFDGQEIGSVDHLVRLVGAAKVGVKVGVRIWRDRKPIELEIVPMRKPDLPSGINIYSWRGIELAQLSSLLRSKHQIADEIEGVLISGVGSDTAAKRAGFEVGQVIVQIGEVELKSLRHLRSILPQLEGPVKVRVHGGEAEELTLP